MLLLVSEPEKSCDKSPMLPSEEMSLALSDESVLLLFEVPVEVLSVVEVLVSLVEAFVLLVVEVELLELPLLEAVVAVDEVEPV